MLGRTKKAHRIYFDPKAYDIAFSFRDEETECTFLQDMFKKYGEGDAPQSVLECFAGPARHARWFANKGVTATAIDNHPGMVAFSDEEADPDDPFEAIEADAETFDLEEARFDLVFTLMDSLAHLTDKDELAGHFERVAHHLNPGGVYVIESGHPRELTGETSTNNDWLVEEDAWKVRMVWGLEPVVYDSETGIAEVLVVMEILDATGAIGNIRERVMVKRWTPQEMETVAQGSGLDIVGWYGALNESVPFDKAKDAWRMIVVLKKTPTA